MQLSSSQALEDKSQDELEQNNNDNVDDEPQVGSYNAYNSDRLSI